MDETALISPLLGAVAIITTQDVLLRVLAVFLLIAINAFFVAAEFSMVAVRRSRITQLVEKGDIQAETVQRLQQRLDLLLSTTQIGITLSSLALGWIGESTMAVAIQQGLFQTPMLDGWVEIAGHSIAIPIAFFLIAYLQIVLGELSPKSIALHNAEEIARFLATPSLFISRLFSPFIWVLNRSTQTLLRLLGLEYSPHSWYNRVTSEELQLIIATERESTGLEIEERELLNNVFEFSEVLVEEIMIPRTNIASISRNATFGNLLEEVVNSGHSRYPITGDSLDDIVGMIDFKALAVPLAKGRINPETKINPWIKPVRFVPEFTPLGELLTIMRRSRLELVMVVDEFGGTAGLVTLKDLIDEIIGDDSELGGTASGTEEISLQMLDDQTFLVQAQMNLEQVNELLDLDLPITDEYQTIGGFVIYQFQKIPKQGETLLYDNLELTVTSASGPRIYQIRIHRHDTAAPEEIKEIKGGDEEELETDPDQ
ncbi:HlyC/CorC family transporter [Euhalothece natronophila Z-M001]|uniref:HlyC/CorC family transporter n=1 Tax=Euhalothece natronophila Z-M001 TaxID=522448 RepID=A0A5B8NM21_9CHRO|nr:hemolysin family protein [Euhalothece natronophila]QDZ40363.1 HlyC/CorC family transporter [Euhalothece natronophila Z-M001]